MKPEELDELLNGEEDVSAPRKSRGVERESGQGPLRKGF
jgi:hypothetical protein